MTAGMKTGFDDHRGYTEFLVMDGGFDGMDKRFDRLEQLIKAQ